MKKTNQKPAFNIGETVLHYGDERIVEQVFGRMWGDELSAIPEFAYIVVNKNERLLGHIIRECDLRGLDAKD